MLISEIEPIKEAGVELLEEDDADSIIDKIVELPLRKACKIFTKKGIRTLMSSANKNNVLQEGEETIEKEYIRKSAQEWDAPNLSFEYAGKGYVWIMLDFDSLSRENKDWLFSLEERKGKNGEKIGEKIVWFVHPCKMGNIEFDLRVGKYDYNFLRQVMPDDQIPKGIEVDPTLIEFEKRHIVLGYGGYPTQSVFLRMPISQQTTVGEVEEYFTKFAENFKTQAKEIQGDLPAERDER